MTAHELIASIFLRVQDGMPGNARRISRAQLDFLRTLIGEDEQGGAMQTAGPGVAVWTPSGRNKYVIREDLRGDRHVLERLANVVPTGMDRLF